MRLSIGILGLLLVTACGGSPTTPSVPSSPTKTAASAPTPAPSPAPSAPADRLVYEVLEAGPSRWVVHVDDAGPLDLHVVTFAAHDPQPGTAPTMADPHPWFVLDGQSQFKAHSSGDFTLSYDPRNTSCGRVQLDASFVDANGRDTLILGTVVDYGVACTPAPKPPPPVTPTCPTGDAAIVLPFPGKSMQNVIPSADLTSATATFSIAPGCQGVVVSLGSYTKDAPPAFLPQTQFDHVSGTFDAGGPYHLTVALAPCSLQADLYRGPIAPGEALTWLNWESDYNPRTLDWYYREACR